MSDHVTTPAENTAEPAKHSRAQYAPAVIGYSLADYICCARCADDDFAPCGTFEAYPIFDGEGNWDDVCFACGCRLGAEVAE